VDFVVDDVLSDASTEHAQPDIPIEAVSVLSRTPEIILRPMDVRRRGIHRTNDDIISSDEGVRSTRGGDDEEYVNFKKKRHSRPSV
jgi:hypothetical protein